MRSEYQSKLGILFKIIWHKFIKILISALSRNMGEPIVIFHPKA